MGREPQASAYNASSLYHNCMRRPNVVQVGANTHSKVKGRGIFCFSQNYESIKILKQNDSHELNSEDKEESFPTLPYLNPNHTLRTMGLPSLQLERTLKGQRWPVGGSAFLLQVSPILQSVLLASKGPNRLIKYQTTRLQRVAVATTGAKHWSCPWCCLTGYSSLSTVLSIELPMAPALVQLFIIALPVI